jgi:hypothetical protein
MRNSPNTICLVCKEDCQTAPKLASHTRIFHQLEVNVTMDDGDYKVKRNAEGKLKCPKCTFDTKNPNSLFNHVRIKLKRMTKEAQNSIVIPSTSSEVQEIEITHNSHIGGSSSSAAISTDTEEDIAVRTLASRNLMYDKRDKFLFCNYDDCKRFISCNFESHLEDKHKVKIKMEESDFLRKTLSFSNYPPEGIKNRDVEIDPLSFLLPINGVRCT